jgi:hypothetical protein
MSQIINFLVHEIIFVNKFILEKLKLPIFPHYHTYVVV